MEKAKKLKKSDHAIISIKSALNLIPGVGGTIASLVGDYVQLSTQKSTERTMKILHEKLTAIESRIDVESINKDEFSELFKSCYLVVVRTHQEIKLRAAAALFANLLLKPGDTEKVSYDELDYFIRCVDSLSIGAITVLVVYSSMSQQSLKADSDGNYGLDFSALHKHEKLNAFDAPFLMGLISELNNFHLVQIDKPPITISQYGNYPIRLTPLGQRFIERIIDG